MANNLPPIALLLFNRPGPLRRVFAEIAAAKPSTLFLIADGPRPDRPADVEKCRLAREVVEQIDWDCQVLRNYSEVNLGCGKRVSSGISWVFERCEEAIILEDDCVPHPDFFIFCKLLLKKYRDEPRVMMISGDNYQSESAVYDGSYYFSRLTHVWGWATWRRAWALYDFGMHEWPTMKAGKWMSSVCPDPIEAKFWIEHFDNVYEKRVDTWDYQWMFACWKNFGLSIMPAVNLVTNIGAWDDATHGTDHSPDSDRPSHPIGELIHPKKIEIGKAQDAYEFEYILGGRAYRRLQRPEYRLRRLLGNVLRHAGLRK